VSFLGAGAMRAHSSAVFDKISVSVSEDVVEIVDLHDDQMTREHNMIKTQLETILEELDEIKRMLKTPQGRRPGFPEDGY
jgi:hypothetical protein